MEDLLHRIDRDRLPRHVAMIMDGNGRWAKKKGRSRSFGHRCAVDTVRGIVEACYELGVSFLTLYVFSTENWKRPKEEVEDLMALLVETLSRESRLFGEKGLRLMIIGDLSKFSEEMRDLILSVVGSTRENKGGNLVLALNYGAQEEILRAVREISEKIKRGEMQTEEIDSEMFESHLYTAGIPPVDLLIRTSGEVRLSNFLLWQIAYAELKFLDLCWPDFSKRDFFECIVDFQKRERRYGRITEQLGEKERKFF